MLHRPVAEPPKDAGPGQAEESLGGVDTLDDDLGNDGGENDGDGGPGGSPKEIGKNLYQGWISFVLFLRHVSSFAKRALRGPRKPLFSFPGLFILTGIVRWLF